MKSFCALAVAMEKTRYFWNSLGSATFSSRSMEQVPTSASWFPCLLGAVMGTKWL